MPRRKKPPIHVAKIVIVDEEGMLVEQDFYMGNGPDVECQTQLHLGGQPIPLAGLLLAGAHSMLMVAEAPETLINDVIMCLQQIHSLTKVQRMAKQQKRHDRKDHGVLDDWPKDQSDSEIPF